MKNPGSTTDLLGNISSAIIATDLEGCVTFWNRGAEALFGARAGDVENERVGSGKFPGRAAISEADLAVLRRDGEFHAERRAGGDGLGRVMWLDMHAHLVKDGSGLPVGCVFLIHDITSRKTNEGMASETQRQLGAIMNSVGDAIVSVDERFFIVFFNEAAERMFQCGREGAIGVRMDLHPKLRQVLERLEIRELAKLGGARPAARRFDFLLEEGGIAPMEATWTATRVGLKQVYTAVIRDVTQQIQIEKTIFQSQKNQAIGALASGIAHDFNNILTAVLSNLDLISLSPDIPKNLGEHLIHAKTSARRGAELVTKLLAFSRQTEPKLGLLNLADLSEEVVFMLRRSIDRRIEIYLNKASPDLWEVEADPNHLMQVLLNLCLNARDAMPQGGELIIRVENVSFVPEEAAAPRKSGDYVRLTVADTGEGIRTEHLSRLFDPYFTTREFGRGAGLGLSIAQSLIMEHGGWIEVESAAGRGSQFHAFLPRARPAAGTETQVAARVLSDQHSALEGKESILIVDDEEVVRLVMRTILAYRGYQVCEAADGEESVAKYRQASPGFDLVLLDLNMPRMNGWETLERLRAADPDVSVILLSGGPGEGMTQKALQVGARGVLLKPFENLDLLRLVRKTLDQAAGGRE